MKKENPLVFVLRIVGWSLIAIAAVDYILAVTSLGQSTMSDNLLWYFLAGLGCLVAAHVVRSNPAPPSSNP
jgi:hypothetical protein